MMRASRYTVRVCGFAIALGIGAAVVTTQCGTACATPSDSSSKDSSPGTSQKNGPGDTPTTPGDTPASAKHPGRLHLLRAAPDTNPSRGRQPAALPDVALNSVGAQTAKLSTAKLPHLGGLTITSTPTPRLSISATTIEAPASLDGVAAIAAVKLTKPAVVAELTKSPPIQSVPIHKPLTTTPTVRTFMSALTSSVLSPLADTSGTPVPADSPAGWTMLAAARRELFGGPAPSLTSAVTPQSVLTSLLSPIATLVFDVFDPAFAAVAGPPVLPPGSTVTVESSTLTFDNGYVAPADWYFPEGDDPQGIIYLQHGFLAQGPIYSYTAAALAEQTNSIVVAPTITSNFLAADGNWLGGSSMPAAAADLFEGDRDALVASASAAAGHPVALPQKVVLVGHSLGGGFVEEMAGDMVDNGTANDLVGVILLDGVAFDPTVPATALGKLDELPNDVPVLLIASDPYFWNLYGQMSGDLATLRPGQFNGVQLVGGRHIDGLQGGNPLIQVAEYAVAGFSQPQNVEAVKILSIEWINDMYAGTAITAPSDQPFQIPTTAGPATAYSIPAPAAPLSPVDQVVKALELFGTSVFLSS